jgi:translation initiation factor IF-3
LPPPFNDRHNQHDRKDQHQRVNDQIRISPIRLIGGNGEQLGVIPTSQAIDMAREAGLDLVEVAANERPPVCKIMDFGKFRYQQSHKQKKTKTHQQKLKEIRLRPKTGDHDVETKINQARKFLEHKDKVLVYVLFKGRELQHIEEGKRIIAMVLEKVADVAKVEKNPGMEGKRMTAMLAPK